MTSDDTTAAAPDTTHAHEPAQLDPLIALARKRIDTLANELACPNCDYELRGLTQPVFDCPECGTPIDIVELAAVKWGTERFRDSAFQPLSHAAQWLMWSVLVVPLMVWLLMASSIAGPIAGVSILLPWLAYGVYAWRGSVRAFGTVNLLKPLAIVTLSVALGSLIRLGVFGVIVSLIAGVSEFFSTSGDVRFWLEVLAVSILLVAAAGVGHHFAERWFTRHCLRAYFRATSDGAGLYAARSR